MQIRILSALVLFGIAAAGQKTDFRTRLRSLERQASLDSGRPAERKAGAERVLVLLVEFGGPDSIEFIPSGPNKSTWDPIGKLDSSEWTGTPGDCSAIVRKYNITGPTRYSYSGPLHNRIERPRSPSDASGKSIWKEDFSPEHYRALINGEGVRYAYSRQDGSAVEQDRTGLSVAGYYRDASGGRLTVEAEVVGWLRLPHSVFWYGADPCPRKRSGTSSAEQAGAIPGAGSERSLVIDSLEAARRSRPDLDWARFDRDRDGVLDHLWIVHAGYGEEADATLLGRTDFGEGAIWSNSAPIGQAYEVVPGLRVEHAVHLPEDAGLAVMVHEFAHSLGADDLYNLAGSGDPSTGIWTIMADSWLGVPSGSQAQAFDPWHLDFWGWLDPLVIADPTREYHVAIGQTSAFPGGDDVYRGVRIDLPPATDALPVKPERNWQWWGGQRDATNSTMTLARPIRIPTGSPALRFSLAYSIEEGWDFLLVQVSEDGGAAWKTLTNSRTTCKTAAGFTGGTTGLPADLCAAGMGGYTGVSQGYPVPGRESFDLSGWAGKDVLLRFWYFTDTAWTEDGPFLDSISIAAGLQQSFNDDAESGDDNWVYAGDWRRNDGSIVYRHAYYLQWRNTGPGGGSDAVLAQPDWSPGPVSGGLLVWYSNGRYSSNNVRRYLTDPPSFGPKGRLLAVNARPEPFRDPDLVARGFANEAANLPTRTQLRAAAFSLEPSLPFATAISGRDVKFEARPPAPLFRDGLGHYVGLERVSPGPGETDGDQWMTRSWNMSVVMPSAAAYGVRGAGYRAGGDILFGCSADPSRGTVNCASRKSSAAADGGTGDPADARGHYGWNVEIVRQTPSSARLRIWNELGASAPGYKP